MRIPTLKVPYLYEVKRVYICLLAVYAIMRDVIPLYYIVSSGVISAAFFGVGFFLVAADVFSRRDCLRSYGCDLLVGFLLVCIISTCVNYRYGLFSNLKAIGWMLLYYCLLYPNDVQKDTQTLPALFRTVTATMTIFLLISVTMYFYDVGYTYYKTEGTFTDQGFSFRYARLWGLFHEANYAAIFSEIALIMSVYLAFAEKRKVVVLLRVIQCILFTSFIILSGSRTAILVLLLASIWMGFYWAFHMVYGSAIKKTAVSVVCGVLVAVLLYCVLQAVTIGIPYVKKEIRDLSGKDVTLKIHALYDDFYVRGHVNIVEKSSDRLFLGETSPTDTTDPVHMDATGNATDPTEITVPKQESEYDVQPLGRTDLADKDVSNGRFRRWKEGFQVFCASPVLGASPRGVVPFAKDHCPETYVAKYSYSISNSVLDLMASTGIIGTVVMLVFLLLSAVHIVNNVLTNPFQYQRMLLTGLIVLIVASAILESDLFFLLTMSSVIFWFTLGNLNGNSKDKMPLIFRLANCIFEKES